MSVKKIFSLFIMLEVPLFFICATSVQIAVEPSFGIKNGQLDELVYLKNCVYSNNKLSELNWPIKKERFARLKLEGIWKHLYAEVSGTVGFPKSSGIMKDSDWLNIQSPDYYMYQYKTNYSESNNEIDSDFSILAKIGAQFTPFKFLQLRPSVGFEFNRIKMTARNGICFYGNSFGKSYYNLDVGPWHSCLSAENVSHYNVYGKLVEYERKLCEFWLGGDILIPIKNLTIFAGFYTSPYLFSLAVDKHFGTGIKYAEEGSGYFSAFKAEGGVSYALTKRNSICANFSYFRMNKVKGRQLYTVIGNSSYLNNRDAESGTAAKTFDFSFSWKCRIL